MNITVLANRDLASNVALNRLLPVLAAEHQMEVFLSSRVGGNEAVPEDLAQLEVFEQSLFNDLLFPALESFDRLGEATGAGISDLNKINSEQGLAILGASNPDLVLSIRYGGILREEVIAIPGQGVLNLHSGLLPDYRGVMATFYAMLNGEAEVGMTLHYIRDAGIDTGDIVGTTRQVLDLKRSYLGNVLQLYPAGVDLMLAAVGTLSAGKALPTQAQQAGGNYYSFPSQRQLEQFSESGLRLHDAREVLAFAKQYLE